MQQPSVRNKPAAKNRTEFLIGMAHCERQFAPFHKEWIITAAAMARWLPPPPGWWEISRGAEQNPVFGIFKSSG